MSPNMTNTITPKEDVEKIKNKMRWSYSRELKTDPAAEPKKTYKEILLATMAQWRVGR